MKTLFLIVGETGSGKDTVVNKLNRKMVVSYTNRPKRDNETDGVEHYFVSDEEFKEIEKNEHLLAPTTIGDIKYSAVLERLNGADIFIIDTEGVKWFKEHKIKDLKIITIGIYLPLEERKNRCSWRSDFNTSFMKRVEAEQEQFDNFRLNGDFDYIIHNHNSEKTAKIIKNIINIEESENK